MAEFKEGDVVRLKSGGPKMTVSGEKSSVDSMRDMIKCEWFAGVVRENGWFRPEMLEIAKDNIAAIG